MPALTHCLYSVAFIHGFPSSRWRHLTTRRLPCPTGLLPLPAAAVHAGLIHRARKVTLLGLIAATYFMVAGGPYALESVVQGAGYLWAAGLLLIVPFIWSLPTALMVSELSSTLPEEGGFYIWVRRGLGPFWGYQEAWLSLAASIFDMAIYPIVFVGLSRLSPA